VFYHPNVQLSVSDAALPVVVPKALKKAIRKGKQSKLSSERYEELRALFETEPV
jgi:uncharacterized protein (DUF2267 family)